VWTSLEALAYAIDRVQEARVLLVLTFRPEFVPPWVRFAHITTLVLNRLTRRQVVTMVEQIAARQEVPAELVEQIVTRTDGVPLFVEELTKTVLESAWLKNYEADGTLAGLLLPRLLPMSLRDALMARLDRLPPMVKEVAQIGAMIGREFAYRLLATVCPWRADTLGEALDALVTAGMLFSRGTPPEATYTFKHALIQDAAYQSLLKSTRQQYHQRIAQMLETYFPEFAATQPEVLAPHCTSGGLLGQAVDYWHQAGQHALQRSACVEAINHVTRGLEVLKSLPETRRAPPARIESADDDRSGSDRPQRGCRSRSRSHLQPGACTEPADRGDPSARGRTA
jgi:predicted ATPase